MQYIFGSICSKYINVIPTKKNNIWVNDFLDSPFSYFCLGALSSSHFDLDSFEGWSST